MNRRSASFMMFSERPVGEFLAEHNSKIQVAIQKETDDYILNVNETEYINFLVQEFTIDIPRPLIDFDINNMLVSDYETQIDPQDYPTQFVLHFTTRQRQTVPRQVVVYHIPFTGNDKLLHLAPSHHGFQFTKVFLEDDCVCFEIINFSNDSTTIQREAEPMIKNIRFLWQDLINDLEPYNTHLHVQIG